MFSCRFYKINPKHDSEIKSDLIDEGKVFQYGKMQDQLELDEDLEIKVDSVTENEYGKSIQLLVDDEMPQWDRRKGEFKIRYTKRVTTQIFEKEPITNFISISGFKKADTLLRQALIRKIGDLPFASVDILLKEKQ